jgi:hypothetical protein
MGYRFAVASGNWSATGTWDQGTLPVAGDYVVANNFTVTVDTNISVAALSTLATDNQGIIPTMTSNTAPAGYIASAQSTSGSQFPYLAFDRNTGTNYLSATNVSVLAQWVQIQIPVATIVNRYRLRSGSTASRIFNNWTFEGSNNGSTWTVLHTVTAGSPGVNAYYTSPLIGNTTAYLYYRVNVTATATTANPLEINEILLLETTYSTASGVSGGGFNVTGTRTMTLTANDQFTTGQAIVAGTTSVVNFSGGVGTTLTLNAGATGQYVRSTTTAIGCVTTTGAGTLNASGQIALSASAVASTGIVISGTNSVTTFTGDIIKSTGNSCRGIATTVPCSLTVIGNIESGSGNDGIGVVFGSTGTLNITGNLTLSTNIANRCYAVFLTGGAVATTCNITGNITGSSTNASNTNATLVIGGATVSTYITGSVTGGSGTASSGPWAVFAGNLGAGGSGLTTYINIVGPVTAGYNGPALHSTGLSAINLMSGPFICSSYGMFPLLIGRMHYIVTPASYFEFRNSTTNGAIPPGAIAPTATMYDPSTIADAPTANNVRSGVVYALGSQTGTLVVPAASSVASGVVFDNGTIGTAVLTSAAVSAAVWNELVANLTTANSIGLRMSSCSTVATTGAQITSLT